MNAEPTAKETTTARNGESTYSHMATLQQACNGKTAPAKNVTMQHTPIDHKGMSAKLASEDVRPAPMTTATTAQMRFEDGSLLLKWSNPTASQIMLDANCPVMAHNWNTANPSREARKMAAET